ncbi:MAG: MotA/TolQ/ExbB proton channel family protein [Prevotella sp.]|nr:MotA/TolQ/ExbB proton channel family protein [Prevotella sp.]
MIHINIISPFRALLAVLLLLFSCGMAAQVDSVVTAAIMDDSMAVSDDELSEESLMSESESVTAGIGFHQQLKDKFEEGGTGFMSLVAAALVLGLACCIERIVYLSLSEIDAKKLLNQVADKVEAGHIAEAKELCRNTRGPVASICYQGLLHLREKTDDIERSVMSYGTVQVGKLERGTSWIRFFIAICPSLGFLGTVIGMVMAFDQIQQAGDIGPTIVAEGMKVALITTIFGIIAALILQLFYNFIISKIEHLSAQMEESAVTLMDIVMKYKHQQE